MKQQLLRVFNVLQGMLIVLADLVLSSMPLMCSKAQGQLAAVVLCSSPFVAFLNF